MPGLIDRGLQSDSPAIVKKATKLSKLATELETMLEEYRTGQAERDKAAAEAREELAILDRRRAELQAIVKPARRTTPDPETAKIRAWAVAQGLEVPERGRIGAELRARYEAAQAAQTVNVVDGQ